MKYLPKETSEYLVSLGCTSESGFRWIRLAPDVERVMCKFCLNPEYRSFGSYEDIVPAFSLEDILRKDNAGKINSKSYMTDWEFSKEVLGIFQSNHDTWPVEISKLINPSLS